MHSYTSVSGVFKSPSHILLSAFTYYAVAPNTKLPSSYYSPFITRVILLYKNIVNSLTYFIRFVAAIKKHLILHLGADFQKLYPQSDIHQSTRNTYGGKFSKVGGKVGGRFLFVVK